MLCVPDCCRTFFLYRADPIHGEHRLRHVGRRLDRRDDGRQPRRPVRAHDPHHQDRRRDPHEMLGEISDLADWRAEYFIEGISELQG